MLTIWNKFIQSLVKSCDKESVKLALALVDVPNDIYRWWVVSLRSYPVSRIKDISLTFLPRKEISGRMHGLMHYYVTREWEADEHCWVNLEEKFKLLNKK